MKISSVLLGVIILVFIFATIERVNAAKAGTANKKVITVNMDAKELPKEYIGDNQKVVDILKASYLQKSEYETNEAYEQRKKGFENKLYAFSYKLESHVELGGDHAKEVVYDAEKNTIRISPASIKYIERKWDDVKGSYAGQNAFGAKTKITKGMRNSYAIELPPMSGFNFDLQMEPVKARLVRKSIRILYWVKIRDVECKKSPISPTFQNPFDGELNYCDGHTSMIEIWCYNFKTGEIYKKFNDEWQLIND